MKFRKKPIVIEAVQFTNKVFLDRSKWPSCVKAIRVMPVSTFDYPVIDTLEGRMDVSINDWIITGVNGEHYPCKPDIFEKTYEKV